MERIALCLATQHDLVLVAIAGVISLLSTAVGFDLLGRARLEYRVLWLAAAALVTGSGIWATHFVAILAYDPGVPLGFTVTMTLVSGLSGTLIAGLGFALMIYGEKDRIVPALAGTMIGGAVAVLHYVGMAALVVPAAIVWDTSLVIASVAVGCALGAVSGYLFQHAPGFGGRLAAALALTLAVGSHHFTAMGAVTLVAEPAVAADAAPALPRAWLVAAIVGIMLVILLLGIVGGTFDRALTLRREREAERLKALADAAFEGIVICRDGLIVDANESFCKLVGAATADEVRGRRFADFAPAENEAIDAALGKVAPASFAIDLADAGGGAVPVEVLKRPAGDSEDQMILAVRDLRERREAESRIRFLAHHDALTGLANRMFFSLRLEDAIARAERAGGRLALYYIDLDRFKEINDSLGHSAGDAVINATARRLEALVGNGDIVARLGGDEFVVVQTNLEGSEAAIAFAERACTALAAPIAFDGKSLVRTASIGVAIYPLDGTDVDSLTSAADVALYRAKDAGRATFRAFEKEMADRILMRRELQRDLLQAVADNTLHLHFQPQVRLSDGEVVCFEALARWTHSKHGPVPPSTFIPLAEESGCILQVGAWVLWAACREASRWRRPVRVAVNVSPVQITQGDLPGLIGEILVETGLNPGLLELEVTESVLIRDIDRALHVLRQLKALGVRVAMDDFGTGYSSLSYLQSFPFDKLKIDRSFVQDMNRNAHARAIIRAVVGLGKALNLPVVAEGVEYKGQLDALRQETCEEVQGFLTGRPQPIEAFEPYLMSDAPELAPVQRHAMAGAAAAG